MTNHIHLLVTPHDTDGPAMLIRDLGQRYVQYFNRRYARRGTLWEGRFRSCLVDSSAYVLACYRYIERNPVRAGMVTRVADYAWSSHAENAGHTQGKLLIAHAEYLALSEKPAFRHRAYRELLAQADDEAFLREIRDATNGGFALLGADLKARLAAETGRHMERRKPGPLPAEPTPLDADLLTAELGLCPRIS